MNLVKHTGSPLTRRRGMVKGSLVIYLMALMSIVDMTICPSNYADEPLPAAVASYPTGKITALYETAFQIDGRTVSFVPEAVLVDRHGDPLQATVLRVDIDVKYHIQKGTTDKIDWMLLILPE